MKQLKLLNVDDYNLQKIRAGLYERWPLSFPEYKIYYINLKSKQNASMVTVSNGSSTIRRK